MEEDQGYEPESDPGAEGDGDAEESGPDPVFGAGVTLLGIFVMGTAGARDMHYVFDVGVVTAVLGAVAFVVCVALSALKQRKVEKNEPPAA
jgi:hypothetical protein